MRLIFQLKRIFYFQVIVFIFGFVFIIFNNQHTILLLVFLYAGSILNEILGITFSTKSKHIRDYNFMISLCLFELIGEQIIELFCLNGVKMKRNLELISFIRYKFFN